MTLLHMMLVDDDPDDQFIFTKACEEIDSSLLVQCLEGSKEFLKYLLTSPAPDLLFLDLNMPGENGIECLKALRKVQSWKETPVIIYSTSTRTSSIEKSYAEGATLYLPKTSTYAELITTLKSIISKYT